MKKNSLQKNQSRLGLIFQICDPGHETGVTLLKANKKKNKKERFIIKQILRDKIEKRINKKNNAKKFKRIRIKFDIKIK